MLNLKIPFIISNHDTLKPTANNYNMPLYHIKDYINRKVICLIIKQ